MEYIKINSSQNVNIDFKLANLLERIAAFFIDILLMILYIWFIFTAMVPLFFKSSFNGLFDKIGSGNIQSLLIILFLVCFIGPIFFYSFLFEFFMNGQTPGKVIMKIKAIKIDGFQMSFIDYFTRWVFRLIDIYFFYGLVAIISILVSKKSQRIGEIASGSATISLKRKASISDTIFTELDFNYQPTFSQVIILTDNDVRLIKENFNIAVQNKNEVVMNQLSEKIENVLKIKNTFATQKEFISVIIKDYNYYTQFN